jgi:hypothetical protein
LQPDQAVERERIAVGHGAGLFHQRGQHAGGVGRQRLSAVVEWHGWDNSPEMKNIVILISGGGSNMAAIVRAAQQQNWAQWTPAWPPW